VVNTSLPPGRKLRRVSLNGRYGVSNTFGFRNKEFFNGNQYLRRRAKEYRDVSRKFETQFCRVSRLIVENEGEGEGDEDSEEKSEAKFEKVEILYNLQKKFTQLGEW